MRLFLPPALFLALLLPTALIPFMKLDVFRIIHKSGTPFWEAAICGLLGLVFLIGARIQFKNSGSEIKHGFPGFEHRFQRHYGMSVCY